MLEPRQLLSATSTTGLFIPATGELNLQLGSQENVRISSQSGRVLIETATDTATTTGVYSPVTSVGTITSANVKSIVIIGGDEKNTIDLNGVTAAAFTALTAIIVDAGNGDDTIIGSPINRPLDNTIGSPIFGDDIAGAHRR